MMIKYFYDPLCGWCYGASPAIERAEALGIKVESYPTGLFAGSNGPLMSPEWAEYAWANDQRIQKITGQVFSQEYRDKVLSNFGSRFDSWMPTVAIAAHESKFKTEGPKFLRAVQKSRYVDGLDNTDAKVLSKLAENFGWAAGEFSDLILDSKFQEKVRFNVGQNLAAYSAYRTKGIPLVVANDGEDRILSSTLIFNENPDPASWFNNKGE